MRNVLLVLVSISMFSVGASSQCPVQTAAIRSIGPGCSEIPRVSPAIRTTVLAAACELAVTIDAGGGGCCNTIQTSSILVIGSRSAATPLPALASSCTLWVAPDVFLLEPGGQPSTTFSLSIPPTLSATVVFVQGGASYVTTVRFPLRQEFALTEGLEVSLQ